MGFVIVAVLSPSATNLVTVAGASTLVGPEQPREKSSILPHRDVGRWTSHSHGADHPSLSAGFLQQRSRPSSQPSIHVGFTRPDEGKVPTASTREGSNWHLVFFLHRQWTSVISVSGRCHNRTSHWKGAVTLIPTCLCQMLILPSHLTLSTAADSL
jgi:hypothetical protein